MPDVFISYKAEEFDEANWVKTTLEANGISCWMAPMSIPGGSNYAVEIPQAIRSAKVFVLVLSERCQLSRWVPKELDQAINEGKTILPFMLENCRLRDDFNFYLSNVQRYAAYENKSAAIEKMIREIRAIIGIPVQPRTNPQPKEEPVHAPEASAVPEQVPPSVPAAKPVKEKKKKEKKSTADGSRKKVRPLYWILPAAIIATILIVVLSVVLLIQNSTVLIAGERFGRNETYITIKDKQLTAEDVDNFSKFQKLSSLSIVDCPLSGTDLNVLFSCAKDSLDLSNSGISSQQLSSVDFTGVSLTTLVLDGNPSVSDLDILRPLSGTIRELSIRNCSVSDLSFLKDSLELRRLDVSGNGVSSLSPLSECVKLESIDISRNVLTGLTGLEKCISLRKIYAGDNQIADLDALRNTTVLSEVDFSDNRISDISLLSNSKARLQKVLLANNGIETIDALSGATELEELNVSGNQIASLEPLSACRKLTRLYAAENRITSDKAAALSGLEKLVVLNLANNRLTETGSIRFDQDAYSVLLDLSHNQIGTFDLPDVRYDFLSVYGNPITDFSGLYKAKGSTLVFDYNENINFADLSESDYYDYYIFDCPLNQQISIGEILGTYKVHFTTEKEYVQS